jgi:hypothetical protein
MVIFVFKLLFELFDKFFHFVVLFGSIENRGLGFFGQGKGLGFFEHGGLGIEAGE